MRQSEGTLFEDQGYGQGWKVVYPLPEVLFPVVCGTIEGGVRHRRLGEVRLSFLRGFASSTTAKHLFVCRHRGDCLRGSRMIDETFSEPNCEDLASIPMAQGGLTRLAIARLKSAGVPVAPLLRRAGLTPELVADPEGRLSVRSQIRLLDEAAKVLKDDWFGFTLARDFDPRELGLLYYVMASNLFQ